MYDNLELPHVLAQIPVLYDFVADACMKEMYNNNTRKLMQILKEKTKEMTLETFLKNSDVFKEIEAFFHNFNLITNENKEDITEFYTKQQKPKDLSVNKPVLWKVKITGADRNILEAMLPFVQEAFQKYPEINFAGIASYYANNRDTTNHLFSSDYYNYKKTEKEHYPVFKQRLSILLKILRQYKYILHLDEKARGLYCTKEYFEKHYSS